MATLPLEVGYGTVKGTVLLGVEDGGDVDNFPDGIPAQGMVTFTPNTNLVRANETLILPQPISVSLDADGHFQVALIATDDPDLSPLNFTYKVSFALKSGLVPPFNIAIPSNTIVDLAQLVPVAETPGTLILRGPQGPQGIPGPGPQDAQVDQSVEEYLTAHPPTVVTDHGALTGLGDDDHPQYLTNARGDARYVQPASLAPVATAGTYASLTGTVPTSRCRRWRSTRSR